jgi:hypothetical protein
MLPIDPAPDELLIIAGGRIKRSSQNMIVSLQEVSIMTIGKITASQQDIVYLKVRPEDDTFLETHDGAVKANYYVASPKRIRVACIYISGSQMRSR